MKKLSEKTIKGYYLTSVVLGLLLAATLGLILEMFVLDMGRSIYDSAFWDNAWQFLPIRLCNVLYHRATGTLYLNLLTVLVTMVTVWLSTQVIGGKNWRTKMLQATAISLLALLILTALACAMAHLRDEFGTTSVIPVLAMAIPFAVLKKTRMPMPESGSHKALG